MYCTYIEDNGMVLYYETNIVVSVMNSGTESGPSACISCLCLLQPEMHLEPVVSFERIYAFVHAMWEVVDNLHSSYTA